MSNGSKDGDATEYGVPEPTSGYTVDDTPPLSPITRSASSVQLSAQESPVQIYPVRTDSIRRSFSENILPNGSTTVLRRSSTKTGATSDTRSIVKRTTSAKHISKRSIATTDTNVPHFTVGSDQAKQRHTHAAHMRQQSNGKERPAAKRSVSGSISQFARRSWIPPPRSSSPSPSRRRASLESTIPHTTNGRPNNSRPDESPCEDAAQTQTGKVVRKASLLRRKSGRPLSSLISKGSSGTTPSVPPIPKSYSTDRLPSLKHQVSNLSEPPALPRSTSFEKVSGLGTDALRKKDELWSAFRSLDAEYHKFQSRPSTTKTAVVRSSLLPFLRNYADHASIFALRAEDLDRRTVILNKWWTGLLEMLNGRYGESVSGNDRPAVLEAATALMVRPEWTLAAPVMPSRQVKSARMALRSRSTTSLRSTMSDFLVDSVFHNVKNTFTQNLLAQMAYVVQKMSIRNVAASVVNFCGKATAYAFLYCEGVAEILVRLWGITSDTLRRVLAEYSITRADRLDATSDRLCSLFPNCVHPLALRSLSSMVKYLRSRPNLPIATAYIPWHSPWVSRWAGNDTDLFFVFTKHYTDLVCQLLPDDMPLKERIVAPGWALVQAQLLTVMHATIQRSNSPLSSHQVNGLTTANFQDILADADATAPMIPIPANGMTRSMAENRLIMLLRDCLANATLATDKARSTFADVYDRILKATARRISLFDHSACFTLCDFLEEAIVILTRYYQAADPVSSTFDWPFWLDVCQQMLQSQNSMTEVRLCAFLFSVWGIVTKNHDTRRDLCLGWLLSRKVFHAQFNHWCPMVRAFYMRLLIWKVARPSPQGSDMDRTIAQALLERLEEVWTQFCHDYEGAQSRGLATPSTVPCSPAPSRELLIIRDDVQPVPSGMFLSFDGILSSSNHGANPYEKHSSQNPNAKAKSSRSGTNLDQSNSRAGAAKKKWDIWKNIMPFSNSVTDRKTPSKSLEQARAASSRRPKSQDGSASSLDQPPSGTGTTSPSSIPSVPFRSLSFKFSLEWVHKDTQSSSRERRLLPPRLPPLAEPFIDPKDGRAASQSPNQASEHTTGLGKYSGRALAEWASLVLECQNFLERRKAEGVPTYFMVETPTLSVEPFRRVC